VALLLIAGSLFGLIHAGAKLVLGTGLPFIPFCALYVGLRVLLQLPIVWRVGGFRIKNSTQLFYLLTLGFIGSSLRITEFVGIKDGLPVALVSFLIYLHPVWTIFFSRWLDKEPITRLKVFKLGLALTGMLFLCDWQQRSLHQIFLLWGPICAGMLISLWICFSNTAQKKSALSPVGLAFYYDLFSFIPLLFIALSQSGSSDFYLAVHWISDPNHLLLISAYSLISGLIPNYCFYFGIQKTTSLAAALLMLFEPVVSAVVSVLAFGDRLSPYFMWGALCILLLNLPDYVWRKLGHWLWKGVAIGNPRTAWTSGRTKRTVK
jgi:drug/metabolite transporter (DMT)-like permease